MILPDAIRFQYCYDGLHLPAPFEPTVCIMRVRNPDNSVVGHFQVCTLIHDPETPNDKFWVEHNSITKKRVTPFAYLVLSKQTNTEFLETISKFKSLTYNLKTPY